MQYFELEARRIFSAGNRNTYVQGELHPDRVMQEHDFVYIVSGSWEICQDDRKYALKAGDVILLHALRHHYGLTPCSPGTQTMFLHFSRAEKDSYEICWEDRDPHMERENTPDDKQLVPLQTVIRCEGNSKVKSLFSDIIYALQVKSYRYEVELNAKLSLLLLELYKCSKNSAVKQDEMVESIIRLFQSHPERRYTVKQLAERYYISEKTLSRRFFNFCGKSIHRYQNELKLEMVRRFLAETPAATLRDAALNYGFCDEFHLSKAYKKKYGASPRNYL